MRLSHSGDKWQALFSDFEEQYLHFSDPIIWTATYLFASLWMFQCCKLLDFSYRRLSWLKCPVVVFWVMSGVVNRILASLSIFVILSKIDIVFLFANTSLKTLKCPTSTFLCRIMYKYQVFVIVSKFLDIKCNISILNRNYIWLFL